MNPASKNYTTISVPRELYETVRIIVKSNPQYTSISEFAKEAIRDKIRETIKTQQNVKGILQ